MSKKFPVRIRILGAPIDCVDMSAAVAAVDVMVKSGCPNTIIALNPEKVIKAQSDSRLLTWLNNASLVIPDGIGVVFAVRLLEKIKLSRVPGAELMPEICAVSVAKGYRIFLYGASPDTIEKAVLKLTENYPGIQIVGYQDGYHDEKSMPDLIERINSSRANILFVALGSPKQELWMETYLHKLEHVRVCQGVGGTFDVIAGTVKRAPKIFRDLYCEWLYRLLSQPKRMLRQTALPKFALKVIQNMIFVNK
jgi:N-acetylglucosaminyldiphosphoundecaprenol N-acetyl-beta-D-mannosaminyltransferase